MRIGITREASQLADLKYRACERGIEIIPVPLISIKAVPFVWPSELGGSSPDWVLFSSAAGVSTFFECLRALNRTLPKTVRYAAIGKKTADGLFAHGLEVSYVPSQAYGKVLFNEMIDTLICPNEIIVYARAADVAYDPASLFAERGIRYYPLICYDTVSNVVDPQLIMDFDSKDYLLFTAPSAVRSYQVQFGQPRMCTVAIGHTTGGEMERQGWSGYALLPTPDINKILEFVK